jgi:hypothetical protein
VTGAHPSFDPWRHVDADDDLVADFLAGSLEAVVEAGGWIHPAARLVVRGGHARVTCEGDPGQPLLNVPREAIMRIAQADWGVDSDGLVLLEPPEDVTDVERELLLLQVAFHNSRGALPALSRAHPILVPDLPPPCIAATRGLVPDFRVQQVTAVDVFWGTRAFRLPVGVNASVEPAAVPLIDLLDHHVGGATPDWTGNGFRVDVSRPTDRSDCFLDYGMTRDALEMAVVYGFVDTSVQIARSAPVTVEVPGIGLVTVSGDGRTERGATPPPTVTTSREGVRISHVVFDPASLIGVDPPEGPVLVAALTAIAVENLRLLQELRATCPATPAGEVLSAAAAHQAGVISAALA